MKNYKRQLGQIVFHILKKGRPNWDIPHTKAVIFWSEKICEDLKFNIKDRRIVIASAYLHDIGYSKTKVEANYESVEIAKKLHMKIGADMAEDILEKINFKSSEIKKICRIILHHDLYDHKRSKLEQVLFEADQISHLDIKRVKPSFNKKDCLKFLKDYEKFIEPMIENKKSKEYSNQLKDLTLDYLSKVF